uniref:NADH dehydrogenase subunit 6 n=1 Tax=Turanoclytus namaganensis TaxID=2874582 RepID=UPI001EDED3AB|nr:NADH dehydrogenase subunit 6 [Turanoclytus namaganensis]UHY95175.1 NADH dehydrogenase subunit 6 [Turanoclytus namaganensis]
MIIVSAILSGMFIFLNHPLTFGLILLIQTTLVAILSGMMNLNFWYSYILFLVMVGGMLILFMYMTSVASNEKFKFSFKMIFPYMFFFPMMMTALFMDPMIIKMKNLNYEITLNSFKNSMSLSKYMNFPNSLLMILIISYLLLSLIMVVKITKIQYGPLRQKF